MGGRKWTPEEEAYIREHIRKESIEDISKAIGRSKHAIKDRANLLGLSVNRWTDDELQYITENWGVISVNGIAKVLGRTPEAIRSKASKMDLGPFLEAGGLITFYQLIIAVTGGPGSYTWFLDKWKKLDFPFHRRRVRNNTFLMVDIDEWWKWAEEHQSILDFSRFEENIIGKEPAWAKEKRRRDWWITRRISRPWTKTEDDRLLHMLEAQRYSIDEIAAALDRREGAIRRRITSLGTKHRPVRNPGKRWTTQEVDTLLQRHREGREWEEIGAELGRTGQACRARFERVLNPQSTNGAAKKNKAALRGYFQRHQCTHFTTANGCDIRGTNCDTCKEFNRKDLAKEYATGWISSKVGHEGQQIVRKVVT